MNNPHPMTTTQLYRDGIIRFCFRSPAERNAYFKKYAVLAKLQCEHCTDFDTPKMFDVPVLLRNRNRMYPQGICLEPRNAKLFDDKEKAEKLAARSPEVTRVVLVRDLYTRVYKSSLTRMYGIKIEQLSNRKRRKEFFTDIVSERVIFYGQCYDWNGNPYIDTHGRELIARLHPRSCNGLKLWEADVSINRDVIFTEAVKRLVAETAKEVRNAARTVEKLALIEKAISEA